MRNPIIATLAVCAIFCGVIAAAQDAPSQAAVMLMDVGPGGNIFRNPAYAAQASLIVNEELGALNLQNGDSLVLRTFGSPDMVDQLALADWNWSINFAYRGAQAKDIPPFIDERIAALAEVPAQASSDLMVGLADLSGMGLCEKHQTLTTIILSNGIESGEVSGQDFILPGPPSDARLCGRVVWVGLWVDDPVPVPGLKAPALELFIQLAKQLGASDAEVRR